MAVRLLDVHREEAKTRRISKQFSNQASSFAGGSASSTNDGIRAPAVLNGLGSPQLLDLADEAFRAEYFASVIRMHEHGESVVIGGESHNSILHSSAAINAVAGRMRRIPEAFIQNIRQGK